MLFGFAPDNLSLYGIADWLMLAAGITIGGAVASTLFNPLESSLSKGA